ncbi:hypothetical protein [Aquiflexum lacus]|uniref:hypothetical protein n=1 Tax=Aquiflexum lacus TaxID=2483805 RepID=UPI00189316D1|nr:hypothetical protein [Aquiflexum lacus]
MKSCNPYILIAIFISTVFCLNCYGQTFQTYETNIKYYYGSIDRGNSTFFKFYIPADQMAVFTLKTKSYGSDYDIYTYNSSNLGSVMEQSTNPENEPELIVMPVLNYGRWIYVKIQNYGNYGEYYFFAHNVDIGEKFGEALILAMLEGIFSTGNEVDDRDLSRGLNVASSILKNSSLEDASRSYILNELTNNLRKELGYGATAGFFVNFIVSLYDDILKNVW